jgi:hypothetical protein
MCLAAQNLCRSTEELFTLIDWKSSPEHPEEESCWLEGLQDQTAAYNNI